MKSIVMSFQPKWLAKILNGEKTVEVRTRFPNELPVEVFMACTKGKPDLADAGCSRYMLYKNERSFHSQEFINGKVVGKFTVEKVSEIYEYHWINQGTYTYCMDLLLSNPGALLKEACLTLEELHDYLGGKNGLALHISNLEIFDKPKELSEFAIPRKSMEQSEKYYVHKAPQSYCYVILPEEAE